MQWCCAVGVSIRMPIVVFVCECLCFTLFVFFCFSKWIIDDGTDTDQTNTNGCKPNEKHGRMIIGQAKLCGTYCYTGKVQQKWANNLNHERCTNKNMKNKIFTNRNVDVACDDLQLWGTCIRFQTNHLEINQLIFTKANRQNICKRFCPHGPPNLGNLRYTFAKEVSSLSAFPETALLLYAHDCCDHPSSQTFCLQKPTLRYWRRGWLLRPLRWPKNPDPCNSPNSCGGTACLHLSNYCKEK